MTPRLVAPPEAADKALRRYDRLWPQIVCAEAGLADPVVPSPISLRPDVTANSAVESLGYDVWHEWKQAWQEVVWWALPGVTVRQAPITVAGLTAPAPRSVEVTSIDAAVELARRAGVPVGLDVGRSRAVASRLATAGAELTPTMLRKVLRLKDVDVEIVVSAVAWLGAHDDLSRWTARQLPVPGMHTKWIRDHHAILKTVTGRDVRAEVRPRLVELHLTYLDPGYRAAGGRQHDSWAVGDSYDVAYQPRVVLVVENRDCRLFPPIPGALVVEGCGAAAASLLGDVPWVRRCERLVYWGDIDADGFGILSRFRRTMRTGSSAGPKIDVESILMDAPAVERYREHGQTHAPSAVLLEPDTALVGGLSGAEAHAYALVATHGDVPLRRIEQEHIPLADAAAALAALLAARRRDSVPDQARV